MGVFQSIFKFRGHFGQFLGFGIFFVIFRFIGYFGYFFLGLGGHFLIFRFREYFGNFLSFGGVSVVFKLWGYFGNFVVFEHVWSFLGLGSILVILNDFNSTLVILKF